MRVSCATSKPEWLKGSDVEQETFCFNESLTMKARPPPLQLAAPGERGKEWTEYPGGARSAHLASSPAGRSQVSVRNRMSTSLSVMKLQISVLFLEVPTDLALKREREAAFVVCEGHEGEW